MKNFKYSLIVTIVSILLTALSAFLTQKYFAQKQALADAEQANMILITENTTYKDELGRTHQVAYQAKIDIEILKNSKDSLQREIYKSCAKSKDRKKIKDIIAAPIEVKNEIKAELKPADNQEIKVGQLQDGYLDALTVVYSDSIVTTYQYNDTLWLNIIGYKDKWKIRNLFTKRELKYKADAHLSNKNAIISDLRFIHPQ